MIVLRSQGEMEAVGSWRSAGFVHRDAQGALFVSTAQSDAALDRELFTVHTHELAHLLSAYALPRQPRWLAEGLAAYLETLYLETDGRLVVGAEGRWANYVRHQQLSSLEGLWAWGAPSGVDESREYATSWLLVHLLLDEHPEAFAEFERRLTAGEAPRAAWEAALPAEVRAGLSAELGRALSKFLPRRDLPAPSFDPRTTSRPMSEAEVLALRAQVRLVAQVEQPAAERRAQAQADLDRAVALEPDCLPAQLLRLELVERAQRGAPARALALAHPESGRAWVAWLDALPDQAPERAGALALAERHLGDEPPDVLARAAMALGELGRLEAATGAAEKAVALAPWSFPALEAAARVAHARGRCAEAAALQGRAIAQVFEQAPPQVLARLEAARRTYQACAATP